MPDTNAFIELAARRYSVRKFTQEPVRQEDMNMILRAGHLAPTACNLQPQKIFVLQSQDALEKLYRSTRCHFNCPTALVVCHDKSACWTRKYDGKSSGDIDASIVTTHMMLAAESVGVGTCWVMHFNPAVLRAELALPENLEPTAILVMGYPAEDAAPGPMHAQFKDEADIVTVL